MRGTAHVAELKRRPRKKSTGSRSRSAGEGPSGVPRPSVFRLLVQLLVASDERLLGHHLAVAGVVHLFAVGVLLVLRPDDLSRAPCLKAVHLAILWLLLAVLTPLGEERAARS